MLFFFLSWWKVILFREVWLEQKMISQPSTFLGFWYLLQWNKAISRCSFRSTPICCLKKLSPNTPVHIQQHFWREVDDKRQWIKFLSPWGLKQYPFWVVINPCATMKNNMEKIWRKWSLSLGPDYSVFELNPFAGGLRTR